MSLQPVFGPKISVSHRSIAAGFSSRPALRASAGARRTAPRKGIFSSVRKLAGSSSAMGNLAVYALALLVGAGLISYVFLINSAAAKGYEMKKIQNRIAEQSDTRHSLEIKAAEMASLSAIDQAAETEKLVGIKSEEFLTPTAITALKTSK